MIDLLSPETLIEPYPTYNKMREENPICEIYPGKIWVISRYCDVKDGLNNQSLFTSKRNIELFSPSWLSKQCRSDLYITTQDAETYRARRSAISGPFLNNMIKEFRGLMEETAQSLTKYIENNNQVEFFQCFAYPYIGRILSAITGLDGLQNQSEIHQWIQAVELATVPNPDATTIQHIETIITKQKLTFGNLVHDRRENKRHDFISTLLFKQSSDGPITDEQMINVIELLIRTAYQTTVHLLAIGVIQLIRNQNLYNTLMDTPALIPAFVDELLRLFSSLPFAIRHAEQDVTMHSVTIPKGDQVLLSVAAANRDPRIFTNPDAYDLTRKLNRRHLGW